MAAKRRLYRELLVAEGRLHKLVRRSRSKPFQRFGLTDEQRKILKSWWVFAPGSEDPTTRPPVHDPTSEDLEPDLRRFEREGDAAR